MSTLRHRAVSTVAAALFALFAATTANAQLDTEFEDGVVAYRRGDWESARALWSELADEPLSRDDRAVLYYDLGNAAFRSGRVTEAVAWYTSSVAWKPRNSDAWSNLEFARRQSNVEPADRGDLSSTIVRLLTSLDYDEAKWLLLASLLPLLLALTGEALRGGALWRRLSFLALVAMIVAAAPLVWQLANRPRSPYMILEQPGAALRSEPRADATSIAQAETATVARGIDRVPGWVRLETIAGERGWVPADSVLELRVPQL